MSNFSTAVEATETALNSAGSAAKENLRYTESLEAKTQQLKATFQDLANNIIESELVSAVLTLANDALGTLNTQAGQTIVQFTLLTGVLTGFLSIGGTLLKHLVSMTTAVKGLSAVAGASGLAGTLGAVASAALPVAAAIAAIVVAGIGLKKLADYLHPSLEEIEDQLQADSTQLEENKRKLEELNSVTYVARTPEIEEEIRALQEANEELEKNIELNNERANRKKLSQIQNEATFLTEQKGVGVELQDEEGNITGSYTGTSLAGLISQLVTAGKLGVEWDETVQQLIEGTISYDEALEDLKEELGDQIVTLTEWSEGTNTLEASLQDLLREYENYNNKLASGETLTIQEQQAFLRLKNNINEAYSALKEIDPETEGYTQTITDFLNKAERLIPTFEEMSLKVQGFSDINQEAEINLGRVANGLAINTEQANRLKQVYPELNEYLSEQNGLWTINTDLIFDSAFAGEKWAQDMAASFIKATEEAIEFNKVLAKSLLNTARLTRAEYGAGSKEDITAWNEYATVLKEIDQLSQDLVIRKLQQSHFPEPIEPIDPDDTNGTIKAVKTLIDLLKEELELLDHQAFLAEKNGKDQMELVRIYEEAQKRIHAVAEEYRKQGYDDTSTEIRELQELWWDYADEIDNVYSSIADAQQKAAEEAEQAWRESLENQIEELNNQKTAYETTFNYIADQIQKEIDALQDQRDAEEELWNDKIEALEKQNDEIEKQIELEQLQEQLARARQGKVLVYKDGRFQYVQDVEAISEAEKSLEEYEREEALRQETENLEQLRDQALAAIDDQIKGWEKYKEEWSSVVDDYQEEQDRLLAEQVLGIELEGENWKTRLDNLTDYISQYKALMAELTVAQNTIYEQQSPTTGGSSSSGGGGGLPSDDLYFDESGSTAWIPGVGNVHVDIENGHTITTDLPVGTIVSPGGSSGKWEITGVNPDGSYQSKPVKGYASGTLSADGGISLVGEKGPELRVLGSGDGVIPSNITKNLMDIGKFSLKELLNKTSSITYNTFDKIVLPNVTDYASFVNEMKKFKQFTFQN